ncbi:hypothetical protein Tco_0865920 [Tanacetum coccineum]
MKLSEVKKFCDGTLEKIRENLIDMVKRNKLGTGNKRLKGRDWTDMDVEKSNEMVDKIDKVLKRREQLRRLEEYVEGRPKTINPSSPTGKTSSIAIDPIQVSSTAVMSIIPDIKRRIAKPNVLPKSNTAPHPAWKRKEFNEMIPFE